MGFRPDIKPPMWGPLSAVQYAVRHNAERMGIDPASIKSYFPFWERAGSYSHDIIRGSYNFTGAQFTDRGLYLLNDEIFIGSPLNLQLGNKYSIFTLAQVRGSSTDQYIFSSGVHDGLYLRTDYAQNNNAIFVKLDDGVNDAFMYTNGSGVNITDGLFHSVGAACDGAILKGYTDAAIESSVSVTGVTGIISERFCIGASGMGSFHLGGTLAYILFIQACLSQTQIAQLHATPYALLMPVARPFIFDMAGGGGLAAPTLISPAQFSTQSQPVTLQWSAVAGATKYQVQVAQDSLFTTPSVDQIVTGGTTLGVDGLAANTEHFWRVRAGDDN